MCCCCVQKVENLICFDFQGLHTHAGVHEQEIPRKNAFAPSKLSEFILYLYFYSTFYPLEHLGTWLTQSWNSEAGILFMERGQPCVVLQSSREGKIPAQQGGNCRLGSPRRFYGILSVCPLISIPNFWGKFPILGLLMWLLLVGRAGFLSRLPRKISKYSRC